MAVNLATIMEDGRTTIPRSLAETLMEAPMTIQAPWEVLGVFRISHATSINSIQQSTGLGLTGSTNSAQDLALQSYDVSSEPYLDLLLLKL